MRQTPPRAVRRRLSFRNFSQLVRRSVHALPRRAPAARAMLRTIQYIHAALPAPLSQSAALVLPLSSFGASPNHSEGRLLCLVKCPIPSCHSSWREQSMEAYPRQTHSLAQLAVRRACVSSCSRSDGLGTWR
ncbi:hypothetical protein K458DRAFT_100129 [Lentithecium fluviatile CBS 122367]|uniref:Uncharacterized protein n=1 Tax=Lentithecium fluviatile CBS 122367 TaxID=1168545 RepID=A0A6G1JI18_9PLEO|nr:hypothetical protein K458DRAFT_100129 [Lentithecium fluviatile CBS 122367]